MDVRLLVVQSITALYQASGVGQSTEGLKELIKQALVYAKLPENPAESQIERTALSQLRTTLLWMINQTESQAYGRNDLLQRLRLNVGQDDKLYSVFERGIVALTDDSQADVQKTINRFRKDIRHYISLEKVKDTLKKASYQASFRSNEIKDLKAFSMKVAEDITNLDVDSDLKNDPAVVADIDFDDPESMDKAYEQLEELLSSEGIIKTPFKAVNRSFGENDGIRRGEFVLLNALPGQYKSGMLLDFFIGTALFNKPHLFDKTKRAAIAFFSTEDEAPIIMQKIFTILKQRETGRPVDFKSYSRKEINEYVKSIMSASGYKILIRKIRPSMTTYSKVIEMLEDYKQKGYELTLLAFDYLSMLNKEGCRHENKGDEFQDLFRRIREYCAINRIAHPTAHQLSTDVKRLIRLYPDNWLSMLPGKGYYEGCSKLETEVDYEAYIAKHSTPLGTFLEYLWGKHRKLGSTPQKVKHFYLKFNPEPMHGLMYDVDLEEDLSYTNLGGKSMSEGGGAAYYDLEDY